MATVYPRALIMIPEWLEPILAFFVSLLTAVLSLFGIQWPKGEAEAVGEAQSSDVLDAAAVVAADPVLDAAAVIESKEA